MYASQFSDLFQVAVIDRFFDELFLSNMVAGDVTLLNTDMHRVPSRLLDSFLQFHTIPINGTLTIRRSFRDS